MLLSKFCYLSRRELAFIKNQKLYKFSNISNDWFKINKIINKFSLTGENFMPEFDLRQLKFTCSASQPFTKHREIIQTFRETSNLKHLSRNELDKAWFADDAACSDSKDLAKITISDKVLN